MLTGTPLAVPDPDPDRADDGISVEGYIDALRY